MRPEYDFSQAVPNPYSKRLRANNAPGPIATEPGKEQPLIDQHIVDWPNKHRFVFFRGASAAPDRAVVATIFTAVFAVNVATDAVTGVVTGFLTLAFDLAS